MSSLVTASIPADQFALAQTFRRVPSVQVDAVRLVTCSTGRDVPLLWTSDADPERVREAIAADPTTDSVQLVSRLNDASLYRVEWAPEVPVVTALLVEADGVVLSAGARNGEWTFRVLFPEHDAVSRTYDVCSAHGLELEIDSIRGLTDAIPAGRFDLTEEQFRSITAAFERGYYEVPRQTTLEDLASDVGVSHQALSERLRRGHSTLVENVLGTRLEPEIEP